MSFNIYALLTPIALSLLIFELIYSLVARKGHFTFQETIANMGTAIGAQTMNLLVAALVFWGFGILHAEYSIMKIPNTWWSFILCFLLVDFLFYWFHRAGHRVNVLWAAHSPHHSAEEFNLAVGLRASITQRLFSFSFFWPLALLGFDPKFMYMVIGTHLIMGYWHHTKVIGKMGWFEKWFNTPSHHRVHHGTNAQYIDKNYAEFLILWDKWFGTFEPEEEEVCYGVLDHPKTWNPLMISLHHFIVLGKLSWNAPHAWDKIKVWFMPPGWMPRGLGEGVEKKTGMTVEEQVRFKTDMFRGAKPYLITQLILGLGFMVFVIDGKSPLSGAEKAAFSGLIWMMIISWGGILESKRWAPFMEIGRLTAQVGALFWAFSKYDINIMALNYALPGIALASAVYVLYFFRGTPVDRPGSERAEGSNPTEGSTGVRAPAAA